MSVTRTRRGVAAILLATSAGLASGRALAQDDLAKRGEYLARAADCMSCHSGPGGPAYAGGLPMQTPFGTIYSSNITQDPETGIGGWTEADLARSLREGKTRDGSYIYPAMPYTSYTKITDEDIHALWAFVQTIPPVKKPTPENDLAFPFSIRTSLIAWQTLFLKDQRFQPTPGKDATWNRGAYLVDALGHCSQCHSPRNALGATDQDKFLSGNRIDAWYAPNIGNNPLSGIKDWSVDKLVDYLKGRQTAGTGTAAGPMAEVVHTSLAYLTDDDVRAMAVYLKDAPPPEETPEPQQAAAAHPDRIANGQSVYNGYCRSCHQEDGQGKDGVAPHLAGDTSVTAKEPYNAISAVLQGFAPQQPWGPMPSFATALRDESVADVVNYIRTSWGNQAEPSASADLVASWRVRTGTAAFNAQQQSAQLVCPKLANLQLDPATSEALAALRDGDPSRDKVAALVDRFRAANPQTSKGDTVNALLTSYCDLIAGKDIPYNQKGAQLASFTGGLAQAVAR